MQKKKKKIGWAVYEDGTVNNQSCQKWFAKLNNIPCLGRTVKVDRVQIKILFENNQCYEHKREPT